MTEATGDRGEFSLLVDRASRIIEVRGMAELYLGARPNKLIGQHLVGYLDDAERLAFLRYMARLLVRGEAEPVVATLRTPAVGIKRFSMVARHGGGNSWWLMFSHEEKHPRGHKAPARFDADDQPFANTAELATLADAHDLQKQPLDLTVFRAEALRGNQPTEIPIDQRMSLDDQLGESLKDHAYHHIVARPDIGEYALLHQPEKTGAEMGRSMAQVAERNHLSPAALAIVHETRNLKADMPAAQVIQEIRRKIQRSEPGSLALAGNAPALRTTGFNWIPAAITAACALVVLAVWLVVHSRG